jgi:CBS domain-containing protein
MAYTPKRIVNADNMINEVAKMMEINARNMVAPHFRRRLHQYIRFRYAPQRELQLKYKDTKQLADSCYRVRKIPVIDDEGRPTGQSTSVWTEWGATNDPIE